MSYKFPFSPAVLDNLPSPRTGFDVVQDVTEPRLRLYVTSRGVKTFFTRKRVHGRDTRIILGAYPNVSIDDARDKVSSAITAALTPIKVRKKNMELEKVIGLWLDKKIRREKKSKEKLVRALARHFAPFAGIKIGEITNVQILDRINQIANDSGLNMANKMLESIGSIMSFAVESGFIEKNPADKISKHTEHPRTCSLSKTGLRRLMSAFEREKNPVIRNSFLMLVYGFANRSAIFAMQWRDLNFNQYTWRGRPLSDKAVLLLSELPQTGRWVFPGRAGGHLTDPRRAWADALVSAKLAGVQIGDIYKLMSKMLGETQDSEDFRLKMNTVLESLTTNK